MAARVRLVVRDPRLVDIALAVALTVMAQLQLPAGTTTLVRAAMLVTTGCLALRRRAPLLVTGVVAASVALMGVTANPPSVFGEYLAVMLASFTVAEQCSLPMALSGLLLLIAGIVGHDWQSPQFGGLSGFVSDSAIPVVVWLVGRAVYLQRSRVITGQHTIRQLEAERKTLAEAAVAQERGRLARDLHDVVAHSLSVIVIQAQAAQKVLPADVEHVGDALRTIEKAGRATLTEMRRLLGLMREEAAMPRAPQPGLGDLPHLVDQVRSAGLPVAVTSVGTAVPLEPGLDLCAYRVVQEAFTNSLKYARPATASLSISWTEERVEILVTDTGVKRHMASADGRGLTGMRERVLSYGGELDAGASGDGGFRVWCRLPTKSAA